MCGIGGVLFQREGDDAPRRHRPLPQRLQQMQRALRHRGPDGEGCFVDDGVALVHTRLALVDAGLGQQPMTTPDGRFTLVMNGEIYNHADLRRRLAARGAVFRSRCDAEVLLWALALADDDPTVVDDLEGEYAFCFFDGARRCAWLGRDPLGVKPLVVAEDRGALWFASEAKAVNAALPHRRVVDVDVLVEAFVAPSLSAGEVPFRGLRSLAPGAVVCVDADGLREVHRQRLQPRVADDDEIVGALDAAVSDRLAAHVDDAEVGCFLSGGLDSSAITALALSHVPRLRCFSMRFAARARAAGSIVVGDDVSFVRELRHRWPIDVVDVDAGSDDVDVEFDGLLRSQDRVVAWEQELTQRLLARAASRDVKAVLVGDAADETWFGYAFALDAAACASPSSLLERFGLSRRTALLAPHLRTHDVDERHRARAAAAGTPFVSGEGPQVLRENRRAMSTLIADRWLPRLLHNGDLCTMAFGLEARVPFANRRVRACAASIDVDDGFVEVSAGVGAEKAVLRRALAPHLPASIVARRKSALPRDESLAPRWRRRCQALLADADARDRLARVFDVAAVAEFVGSNDDGDVARSVLFSIAGVEGFLRHHIDDA